MKKAFTFVWQAALSLLAMLALMLTLLWVAYALPGGPVRQNVQKSLPTLAQEGMYPEVLGFKLFQLDNYTDTLMLFEAAAADDLPVLESMMTNRVYGVEEYESFDRVLADYLQKGAGGCDYPSFDYSRYWHGYLVILRPLLLFLTLPGIRLLNYVLLTALLLCLLWRLWRRVGAAAALGFGLCQLLVAFPLVPHQLQFSWCFYVAYAGCLTLLRRRVPTRRRLWLVLLLCGGATAYLDLLVTPIITLGLPVAVWLLRAGRGWRRDCPAIVGGSLCWGVGYAGIWASKWLIAGAVTGQSVLADAAHQAAVRTVGDTWKGMELTWGNIFAFVGGQLIQRGLLWPLIIAAVLALAAFGLCLRSRQAIAQNIGWLLIAAMPVAWFVLLRAHSIQHGWFTWRAGVVLLFAGGVFLRRACSLQTARQRIFNRKGN